MSAANAGKLVVVIDDDPPVLETTASLLRSCGLPGCRGQILQRGDGSSQQTGTTG